MTREKTVLNDSINKDMFIEALNNIKPEIDDINKSIVKIQKNSPDSSGQITFVDFNDIKKRSNQRARKILNSIVDTYIDDNIRKNSFISRKMNLDTMMFSQLLYQSITAEYAVTKLLELLDEGNLTPRLFEVLPGLQKSLMEVNKQILTTQNVLEITYKNINHEFKNIFLKEHNQEVEQAQNLLQIDNEEFEKKSLEDEILEVI